MVQSVCITGQSGTCRFRKLDHTWGNLCYIMKHTGCSMHQKSCFPDYLTCHNDLPSDVEHIIKYSILNWILNIGNDIHPPWQRQYIRNVNFAECFSWPSSVQCREIFTQLFCKSMHLINFEYYLYIKNLTYLLDDHLGVSVFCSKASGWTVVDEFNMTSNSYHLLMLEVVQICEHVHVWLYYDKNATHLR